MRKLLLLLLFALPAFGGELEVGGRHFNTSFRGDTGVIDIAAGRGFGASAAWFWTEHFSTEASIELVNPAVSIGDTDLGTLGMTTYCVAARWHFAPGARFSPYAGGGAALVQFGNLDDQSGDAIDVVFDDETTFEGEAGVRWHAARHLFVDFGASYMPLEATPVVRRTNIALPAKLIFDPLTVGVSASWRF